MAAPKQDASANPGQGSQRTKEDARGPQASPSRDAASDLAQAYQDLARGEQAATALEANLSNLESKLDAILAAFESPSGDTEDNNKSDKKTETTTDPAEPGKGLAKDDKAPQPPQSPTDEASL